MKGNLKMKRNHQELEFKTISNILKNYKWSIIFIVLLSILFAYLYIYFKTPTYQSYSIIKVKSDNKMKSGDLINNTSSTKGTKDVLEEISLLKTFKINNHSLDSVDFKVQYYKDDYYKKVELFAHNIPISIRNIKISDPSIIGKMLTITPHANGYTLSYTMPYFDKLKKSVLKRSQFNFDTLANNAYGKKIKNKFFKLQINQNFKFDHPIHIKIQGSKRDIFQMFIQKRLTVKQLEQDTSLIKISFEDTVPQRANQYVNALTKSFIDYSIESKNNHNSKTLNFITQELKKIKQELKNSEQELESHQVSKNIVQPSDQASIYIKNLSDIEIKISENKLKKKLISNLISFIKSNYNLDAIAPSVAKLNDNNTLELISKLQNNQIKEEELQLEYTNEYPELKTIKNQISKIRNQIEYNLKSLSTNIDYENTNFLQRKNSYENEMKKLPSKERELVNIKRNYEVKSKMYEYLLKKEAENNIIQLSTFSDYQIIDDAYTPNVPVSPKKLLIMATSILLGLLFATILSLIRYSRNAYIRNKQDIEQMTSLPIYGSIPYYKQIKNKISIHKELKSPFSEAFRTLRTNLQFISNKDEGKLMLITSTIAGEGKSTTAANLATILEMAKYKTIVVNFDLRKPTLHKFFDISNDKGISSFLSGRDSLHEIIIPTEYANLDIIPSGPIPTDPSELIFSKKLPLLFKQLKESYEYIIIDTAPIGIISDTKTLMQYSDLNLIIIRQDYAKKEFIHTLEEMIEKHQFKNIGLILNASKGVAGEYGYGYSYEYK
ncbi:MAG: Tyrosine-protein kinase Wzc (EC [uncultured Sulfurovum sp.]|uniref:non-specific protein-tyrosine kinase n=1 Tax=uncultured Sulfurovum sp. TaxID=269237 RepID=A0A6S6T518_9BACT|nr:MAG: Tyrosine-protein kinase Wzc (EC [uncultured Sulfurovum sp.]